MLAIFSSHACALIIWNPMNIFSKGKCSSVFIIDESVKGQRDLLHALAYEQEVLRLSSADEGVSTITAFLAQRPWVTSVTILAHGAPGCITLGSSKLSLETLSSYTPHLHSWFSQSSKTKPSDILLYSCEVAAGRVGTNFLKKLAYLTQANIHASSTKVGHHDLGGNWELDTAITADCRVFSSGRQNQRINNSNGSLARKNIIGPFNLEPLKAYAHTLGSDFTAPSTASGAEDTIIPLNILVDPGLISGGSQLDIVGTESGFYNTSAPASSTFTIPPGATSIRITGLGSNNDGGVNIENEDYQTSSIVVDLSQGVYSGHIFHVVGQSSKTNDNYAFSDISIGSASDSGTIVGDNDDDLNSITVSVTGNTLSISETQTRIDQAYLVEYLTADDSSTNFISTLSDVQTVGDSSSTFSLPGNSNLVILSVQDGRGGLGFIHEDKGVGRIIIDLDTGRASGTIFTQTGSGEAESSAYSFVDYDITSGQSILNSTASITGDINSDATALPDLILDLTNNDLTVTRTNDSASAFTSLLSAQTYQRLNVGSSAISLGTSQVSGQYIDDPNTPNTYDLALPGSAQTGTLTLEMSNIAGKSSTNENSGIAQVFVDLENETTSGSFLMMRTTNPDLVSWTDVPFGERLIDHPNTVSNRATANQFQDEIAGVLSFDVITQADGSQVFRSSATAVAGNGTTGFRNYELTWQAQWAGRVPIAITGLPATGSLNAGAFDPITGSWLISPTDLANLAYIPPQHFSGEKIPVEITYNGESQTIDVDVTRVADTPTLTTVDQCGDEDTSIDISSAFTTALVDMDGSETLSLIELSAIPLGHVISDGINTFTASTGNQLVDITNWNLGALSYQGPLNINGTFTIDVRVQSTDDDGFSGPPDIAESTDSFDVIIKPVNDDPIANDDVGSTDEDSSISINLTSNDTDPDIGDDLEISSIDTLGTLGSVTVNADDDSVTYDPTGAFDTLAVGETDTDTFSYTITDGNGGTDTATTTVIISGVNDDPTAIDDIGSTDEETSISINLTGNDTDPDTSDDLTIDSIDTTGTLGSVTLNPDDVSVSYSPNGMFEGLAVGETATDTFSYTVTDGKGGTDTATVTVTINGVNDIPIAVDDTDTTDEDTSISINLTVNDTDLDTSDDLEIDSLDTSSTLGSVTINPDGDSVTYDPNGAFDGLALGDTATDTFSYTITDGNGGTDTATVTITINSLNDTPIAVDDSVSTDEETPIALNLTVNDTDLDATDDLEIDVIDTTGTLGSVTVNPDNDSVTYDPNGIFESLAVGETATDTFSYTVTDGKGGTDTATATITINGSNDNPIAVDDFDSTDAETSISVNLTANDTDIDTSDDLAIDSIDSSGTLGTVTINPDNDSVTYAPNGAFENLAVGETATDTFSYTVNDGNGGTDTATATVIISGINDTPTAVVDTASTDEDTPSSINLTGNDTDPDTSDDLAIDVIDATGTLGSVTVNLDGDSVNYDPNGLFEGLVVGETATDSFSYTVTDGMGGTATAIATITINGVNDIPTALDDARAISENISLANIDLTSNDTDTDGSDDLEILSLDSSLSLGTVSINPNGDSADYAPGGQFESLAIGETAIDTFSYTVTDGNGGTDTATVTVTINGVNDTPTAINDVDATDEDTTVIINLTGNDTDPDTSDDLSIDGIDTSGTTGTVTINPDNDSVTYDPNGAFESLAVGETATDTFSYTVTDGNGGTDTAKVTVTINGVNDTPTALDDADTTDETTAVSIDLTVNDTDPDTSDDLSIDSIDPSGTLGTVTVNPDTDSVTYDPNGAFEGLAVGETATDNFSYTVTDGNGGTDTVSVTVTINGVNDTPTAMDDADATDEDTAVSINLTLNDTDPDTSDDLSINAIDPSGTVGTVTINPDDDSVTFRDDNARIKQT